MNSKWFETDNIIVIIYPGSRGTVIPPDPPPPDLYHRVREDGGIIDSEKCEGNERIREHNNPLFIPVDIIA
jgi:hypothetical protein